MTATVTPMEGNPRRISDSKYWNPVFLSVELGFQVPNLSGIPDSLSCIPDSKAQDSGFNKKNPRIPNSTNKTGRFVHTAPFNIFARSHGTLNG